MVWGVFSANQPRGSDPSISRASDLAAVNLYLITADIRLGSAPRVRREFPGTRKSLSSMGLGNPLDFIPSGSSEVLRCGTSDMLEKWLPAS
jgi:hypothetical protein